jgi:hypothetical protein
MTIGPRLRFRLAATATAVAFAASALALAACSRGRQEAGATPLTSTSSSSPSLSTTTSPVPKQSPVPAESNPPGDIPDNTAFVPYRSAAGGFQISMPEGWARTLTKGSVSFTDKLNSITASWEPMASPPTTGSAKAVDVPDLKQTELAFRLTSISSTTLHAGSAILIVYEANSKPNSVTGKQYRLVVERFELFHHGTEAVLSLSSPVGADNVDPWRTVSESFRWA